MKPIMLATDGSPTAALATETAIEFAHLLDTDLVIVSVWDISPAASYFRPLPLNRELAVLGEAEATRVAADAAVRPEAAGVEARTAVRRGFSVEAICAAAEQYDARLLVVGSHGWGVVKRAVFGSVSTGVLHRATCPVLVVRAERVPAEQTEPAGDKVLA